jgi:hypothetical protein
VCTRFHKHTHYTYIYIIQRVRKLGLGRNGVFGSSGQRFNTSDLPVEFGGEPTGNPPGPGTYETSPHDFTASASSSSPYPSGGQNTSSQAVPRGSRLGGGAGGGGASSSDIQNSRNKGRLLRTHLGSYARLPQVTPNGTQVEEHDLGGYSLKKTQDYRNGHNTVASPQPLYNPNTFDTVRFACSIFFCCCLLLIAIYMC